MEFREGSGRLVRLMMCALIACTPLAAQTAPVPFQRVLELALQHSGTMTIAQADQTKAHDAYLETRAGFLPQVIFGSGLGYSYGVPLSIEGSAPSVFNINSQQFLLNFAQRSLLKASKADWNATRISLEDRKNDVILRTALAYIELDNLAARMKSLEEESQVARKAVYISNARKTEGLDSDLDLKKTQLAAARVEMRIADAQGRADVLRERLSKLTGLPVAAIETMSDSIPKTPEVSQDADAASVAVHSSSDVKLADEKIRSAQLRADAEKKQMLPSIDLAGQYAMLTTFNNYDQYYRKFSRNNYSIGLNIRFPFLDFAQRARADAARADVVKAKAEAQQVRGKVSEAAVELQRSLRQLQAAEEVARLDYEVAKGTVAAVHAKIQSGDATLKDEEQARMDASDKQATYLEAAFALAKAKLEFIRQTGDLQAWALPAGR